MFSVGQLAKQYRISRTTLLYYDSIGLLKPTKRTSSGYRQYSLEDSERLRQIMAYRQTGLSLDAISDMLITSDYGITSILFKRLGEINGEIAALREQQDFILKVLRSKALPEKEDPLTSSVWNQVLHDAGITVENATDWHRAFELSSPEQHHAFLRGFGFSDQEIDAVIEWTRQSKEV